MGEYDFIFSCPPYGDLEVYSDDPLDLSTMDFNDFISTYNKIISACVSMLKEDRFACFVVGDYRDKKGFYNNFPARTIDAFQAAGMTLYNEAILVTAVGSLPIRVGKQFDGYRKLGKTHQNVLIFYKGDPMKIKDYGVVEFKDITEMVPDVSTVINSLASNETVSIKISAKMAALKFNGCEPEYIKNVCHAKCCESSTQPTGTMITIHPSENERIESLGGVVINNMLQPREGEKKCPFKTKDNLCGIHFSAGEPFGCIVSPFTLNKNNTLIVRNRYRLLKCYNDGRKIPAYKAFGESLILLFGEDQASKIVDHFDNGGGDYMAEMNINIYNSVIENDLAKHQTVSD